MSKPKTQAQLDKATDQRLRKTYNISLTDYKVLLRSNCGNCWICGRPPNKCRLSVDHDHAWKKVKIQSEKWTPEKNNADTWCVEADYLGQNFFAINPKKSEAVKELKQQLLRASVRGLCCVWCNRGLRYYHDSPEILRSAARYLDDFSDRNTITLIDSQGRL